MNISVYFKVSSLLWKVYYHPGSSNITILTQHAYVKNLRGQCDNVQLIFHIQDVDIIQTAINLSETKSFSLCGQSFSIMASTKELCPEEIEIFLESDSDTYSEDKG
jgi:hypothetical protein